MLLADAPAIVRHGNQWAVSRGFGTKWRQVRGVPQGINYGVGAAQLAARKPEHEYYVANPDMKQCFVPVRVIDDSVV